MSLGTTPSVEGAKARAQALYRALLYTLGCVAGGAAMAVAVSSAAGFTSRWLWLVLAGGAGLLLPVVAMRASAAMGGRCWQVPKAWWRRLGDLAFVPAGAALPSGVFPPIIFPSFRNLLLTGSVVLACMGVTGCSGDASSSPGPKGSQPTSPGTRANPVPVHDRH